MSPMDDSRRQMMAQELRVRPESIDQMLLDGIPEQDAINLLILRDEAAIDFDIVNGGVQPIKPPVRDIANTYHLFKGDMDKVRQTVHVHSSLLKENKGLLPGIATPDMYRSAQETVTSAYQQALFRTVLTESLRSSDTGSEPIGINLVIGVIMQVIDRGSSSSTARSISWSVADYIGEHKAEEIAQLVIEDALKLPDQDIYLRAPGNRRIVISKPDILLALAKYKPGDTDYYQKVREAIGANADPTREAVRRLQLARLMDEKDDLTEAGMAAFMQARELLGDRRAANRVGRPSVLFDAIATTIESQTGPVNPDSIEVETLRQLVQQYAWKPGYGNLDPLRRLALLTNDPRDKHAYSEHNLEGYIRDFVQSGEEPVDPLADDLFEKVQQCVQAGKTEFATTAIIDMTKVIALTDHGVTVDRLMELNIDFLDNSRQSRVRNALFDVLKMHGRLEAAQMVAEAMKTTKTRERCLAEIAFLKVIEPLVEDK